MYVYGALGVYLSFGPLDPSWDFDIFITQSNPYVDRSLEYPARGGSRVDHDDMMEIRVSVVTPAQACDWTARGFTLM